jgi:molecular chaperone DnaK (HSP70)
LLLLDVVPLSLGIETYGGLMSPLIPRNTRIPASARESFTTFMDRQTGVDIHVLQGERDRADENRSLARFKLKGIEPLPAGMPRIEVNFLIDADGILQVAAKDLRTGTEQAIEVQPSFGLSDAEVERMLASQAESQESDKAFRKLVDARTEAEPVLRSTEKNMEKARALLDPDEFERIAACVKALKSAMAGENPEAIITAKYALNAATVHLAEVVIADSLRQAST